MRYKISYTSFPYHAGYTAISLAMAHLTGNIFLWVLYLALIANTVIPFFENSDNTVVGALGLAIIIALTVLLIWLLSKLRRRIDEKLKVRYARYMQELPLKNPKKYRKIVEKNSIKVSRTKPQ